MTTKWTDEKIANGVRNAITILDLDRMPTASELRMLPTGNALACAIVRNGGFDHIADKLTVPRAEHDSRRGWRWEDWIASQSGLRGFTVQRRARMKDPIDLTINGHSVDVKMAVGRMIDGAPQWTWRIAKDAHRAEFYVCVALWASDPPVVFVCPSGEVPKTCMTARGAGYGKLGKWREKWGLFDG